MSPSAFITIWPAVLGPSYSELGPSIRCNRHDIPLLPLFWKRKKCSSRPSNKNSWVFARQIRASVSLLLGTTYKNRRKKCSWIGKSWHHEPQKWQNLEPNGFLCCQVHIKKGALSRGGMCWGAQTVLAVRAAGTTLPLHNIPVESLASDSFPTAFGWFILGLLICCIEGAGDKSKETRQFKKICIWNIRYLIISSLSCIFALTIYININSLHSGDQWL